jgi:FkbM family methyltransferase
MASRFSSLIKKKLLGKNKNLVSLDDSYDVIARLLKGHHVTGIIDAGASNGRISKRLLRKFPAAHIYAFEPNPFYIESLKQYAKEDSRFHPQLLALSDHEGNAVLHMTKSPQTTSLFAPGKRFKEIYPKGSFVKSLEKVELVTIDEWAKRNGDPAIQLMKFDIQAGELKALHGAVRVLQSSTLLVYTEIWFNPLYNGGVLYGEIDSFFRKYGFVLYDMFKLKYNTNGLILWGNAIFIHAQQLGI